MAISMMGQNPFSQSDRPFIWTGPAREAFVFYLQGLFEAMKQKNFISGVEEKFKFGSVFSQDRAAAGARIEDPLGKTRSSLGLADVQHKSASIVYPSEVSPIGNRPLIDFPDDCLPI